MARMIEHCLIIGRLHSFLIRFFRIMKLVPASLSRMSFAGHPVGA